MGLRDLMYFMAVVEHLHFGRAAEACCVSQPALSMQIKKLEENLGIQLIERLSKKILITDAGKEVAEITRNILEDIKKIQHIAQDKKNPYVGKIKIGSFPTLAPYIFPSLCQKIKEQLPDLTLLLIEEKTDILIKDLLKGHIDAALLALPIYYPELIEEPLFTDPFYLATGSRHPFSACKTISQDQLIDYELLLLSEGHCMRDQALDLCRKIQTKEQKTFQATSLETLRTMIANNTGITLIPETAMKLNDGLHYIPFEPPVPSRCIGMVYRNKSARTACIKEISRIIKQCSGSR